MSIVAPFQDGKFVTETASSASLNKANNSNNSSGIDSDAFLQLLVAEMQNQDPLEPTTNTEWVSQYAQFTQVSEVQTIGESMKNYEAQGLVGKDVIMKVTDSTGNTDFVSGRVDYVSYEEGKAYLSINDSLYSIDDLDTVASTEYMAAYDLANKIVEEIKKLPKVDDITTEHKAAIESITSKLANMNDYEKTFLDKSVFELMEEYSTKLREKIADAQKSEDEAKDEDTEKDTQDEV